MPLSLVPQNDPVLRTPCLPFKDWESKDIRELIEEMTETMFKEHGVGLAAPQVGKSVRAMTMLNASQTPIACINPEIIQAHNFVRFEEGCLSLPGTRVVKIRASEIVGKVQDISGKWQTLHLKGLPAICFQHELDHLNGVLMIDN